MTEKSTAPEQKAEIKNYYTKPNPTIPSLKNDTQLTGKLSNSTSKTHFPTNAAQLAVTFIP